MDEFERRIIAEVRPYSMVPDDSLALTIKFAVDAIESNRHGQLVECGTWMGGASFAMLLAQRYRYGRIPKPVWMFDSFQGLPDAEAIDGPLALKYQADGTDPFYFDNCTAPLDKVRSAVAAFGFSPEEAIIIPGWFSESIAPCRDALARCGIAVLRVDCDWYKPVKYVLDALGPLVVEEGVIVLDDYFVWDGCAIATHDYLSENRLSYRIRSLPFTNNCAWMIKRAHRS